MRRFQKINVNFWVDTIASSQNLVLSENGRYFAFFLDSASENESESDIWTKKRARLTTDSIKTNQLIDSLGTLDGVGLSMRIESCSASWAKSRPIAGMLGMIRFRFKLIQDSVVSSVLE